MARGRMIDKRVSMSKKIGRITDKARVLWFMLYPHLDQEGRIAFDDLEDLKIEIIPMLKSWDLKKMGNALNELADIGLIILYPNNKKIAIQFTRFEDFQLGLRKDREAKSEIGAPGETPETSGNFRINPALSLSLRKFKEGRKEEKIMFDFDAETFKNIPEKDMERWKKTYPACDIDQELLYMTDWLVAHPEKKKVNYKAFISRWLRKQQDQGGTKKGYKPSQIGKSSYIPSEKEKKHQADLESYRKELLAKYKPQIERAKKSGDKDALQAIEETIQTEVAQKSQEIMNV